MGIVAEAKNGGSRPLSYLYWGWIRHVADEEGVALPRTGSETDHLSEEEAKRLASALRARAEKIRKGIVPRDATSFVKRLGDQWLPKDKEEVGNLSADFDDLDSMEKTAGFFESSGGVTLRY